MKRKYFWMDLQANSVKSVNYQGLVTVLINAMEEQQG